SRGIDDQQGSNGTESGTCRDPAAAVGTPSPTRTRTEDGQSPAIGKRAEAAKRCVLPRRGLWKGPNVADGMTLTLAEPYSTFLWGGRPPMQERQRGSPDREEIRETEQVLRDLPRHRAELLKEKAAREPAREAPPRPDEPQGEDEVPVEIMRYD